MSLRVYVAAPLAKREHVREIHEKLRNAGIDPTSSWADGLENEADLSPRQLRAIAAVNDRDIAKSHALLMCGFPGQGGEQFAEVARALDAHAPVCWVGRRILSTYRDGVFVAESIEHALDVLQEWAGLISRPAEAEILWARAMIWDSVITDQRAWLAAEEAVAG